MIVGLSLANEQMDQVSFVSGLSKIIEKIKFIGAQPMLGGVYPHDCYNTQHYKILQEVDKVGAWSVLINESRKLNHGDTQFLISSVQQMTAKDTGKKGLVQTQGIQTLKDTKRCLTQYLLTYSKKPKKQLEFLRDCSIN